MDFQATKESLRQSSAAHQKLTPLADTQKKQEKKAKEAAEYRAKILKKAQKQENGDGSPSFGRDQAAIKASKKGMVDRLERQKNIEGKATSAQCAFNLANILMVRLKSTDRACNKHMDVSD